MTRMKDATRSQITTTCQSILVNSEDAEYLPEIRNLWLQLFYQWGNSQYPTHATFMPSGNLISASSIPNRQSARLLGNSRTSAVSDDAHTKRVTEQLEVVLTRARRFLPDKNLQIVKEVVQSQRKKLQYFHHFDGHGSTFKLRRNIPELEIMAEVGALLVLSGPRILENVKKQMDESFIKNISGTVRQSLQEQLDHTDDKKCITYAYETSAVYNRRRYLTERSKILSDAKEDLTKLISKVY
jgi:hypothetical protein